MILNEKYKRPESSIDYISLELEKKFILENIINKNNFLIFICFKIYYFIKLMFMIKIQKFSIDVFLNPKNYKLDPYLSDFKIFYFFNYENKLKNFKVEELMSKEKEEKLNLEILKMKFDNILKNYTYNFLKNSKSKRIGNTDWDNNPKKLLKKSYKIIYKNLKNNNNNNLDFKKKIDFSLRKYFFNKKNKKKKKNCKSLLFFQKENAKINTSEKFKNLFFINHKKNYSVKKIKPLSVTNRKIINIILKEEKTKEANLIYSRIINKFYKN